MIQDKSVFTTLLSLTCQDTHPMLFFLLSQVLCEGMLLLGCIKEVSDYELIVSLPNGLIGFVPVTQISDTYSKMLSKQVAQGELLEVRPWPGAVICAWELGSVNNTSEPTLRSCMGVWLLVSCSWLEFGHLQCLRLG